MCIKRAPSLKYEMSLTGFHLVEQLAIQQQIEALQQQQQQIAAHQQYINMGMMQQQPQHQMPSAYAPNPNQMAPQLSAFQFPQFQPQQPTGMAGAHRRHNSLLPNNSMGPPPAPSSGTSGAGYNENMNPRGVRSSVSAAAGHTRRHSLALPEAKKAAELAEQKRKTSGFQFPIPQAGGAKPNDSGTPISPSSKDAPELSESQHASSAASRINSHGRSQSMAVSNPRASVSGRPSNAFQFPAPGINNNNNEQPFQGDLQRRGSQGHGRTGSRNFDGNWRQNSVQSNVQDQQSVNMGSFNMNQASSNAAFKPGHRARGSMSQQSIGSIGNFQYAGQPQLIQLPQGQVLVPQQQLYGGQALNPLQVAQLQALQNAQVGGQAIPVMQTSQHAGNQMSAQQQQRKTLFTPYLPQATLPALLSDGQLVAGVLRVNKKNRSDAYVDTTDLDADIFICGSKDRNRALEGDLVAVELLDVDEVWGQKREKEEKKKRKDVSDHRGSTVSVNDATTESSAFEGGIRRRGSLRQRPTQKKNDDVEVEGQSLLLMEEEEINDEQKPLYAGHIVAVIERGAGQMFSGTLGLLRPSSQATKEKQDAERGARDGANGRNQYDRQQEKPKIVWFKPTDKRVPLIAIPTEQAPRDFVEKHQDYANRIFVACIKRWPITSLHPFGTLVEQLGEMGDLKVETDALLRDNNFGPDDFSDAVLKSVGFENWSVEADGEEGLQGRRDLRSEKTFTIDPNGSKELDDAIHFKTLNDGNVEVGMHVVDVAHFIKANSLVDREAKKRGTGVYLMNRTVNMLPSRLSNDLCCLNPNEDRYTVSVIFKVDPKSGHVFEDQTWVGKTLIKSSGKLSYDDVNTIISGNGESTLEADTTEEIQTLYQITQKLRQARFGDRIIDVPSLRLLYQLDDENVPVEENIFDSSPAHELIEELSHKANTVVAQCVYSQLGEKTLLRRQAPPNPRRLQTFADRMGRIGHDIDTSSSGALQNSLFSVQDAALRKGMETLLVKAMQRAKYCVAGNTTPEELSHFALNLPLYTHFTNPSRRYADIVVHRQLEAVLAGDVSALQEDLETLNKTAEVCNTKKDSAQAAQEQSVHIESCRKIERRRAEMGGDLICEGIVLCVYESAFDILIPEYGFEKRVHCDQLPLKKAEFDKSKRVLELYWEKGVTSSAFVPEDERPSAGGLRGMSIASPRSSTSAGARFSRAPSDDADAPFDDESDLVQMTAGVSLNGAAPESKVGNKEKLLKQLTLREEGGDYIQDITEMTRVPVILKTDLTKSPP